MAVSKIYKKNNSKTQSITITNVYMKNSSGKSKKVSKVYGKNANGKSVLIWPTQKYTVTVNKDSHISTVSGGGGYSQGEEVTLSSTASTGYHTNGWTVNSGGVTISNNKFTMPASDVTVTANSAGNTVTISYNANGHGSISGTTVATVGTSATLKTMSDVTGYEFLGWAESSSATYATWIGGGTSTNAFGYGSIDGNTKTLYAVWQATATAVTLGFKSYTPSNIAVRCYAPNGSYQDYTSPTLSTSMTCYTGCKVVFYHSSNEEWRYNDTSSGFHNNGAGTSCYITVPSTASGDAKLSCYYYASGYHMFYYQSSSGWIKSSACYPTNGS